MRIKVAILECIVFLISISAFAQVPNSDYLRQVVLQIDTSSYSSVKDTVHYQGRNCLFFQYSRENEVCDVKLFPSDYHKIKRISLVESADFKLLDSVVNYNNQYYTFKVQFQHLSQTDFLRFRLNLTVDTVNILQDIPLLPVTQTSVQLNTRNEDLSVGEEKVFELMTNHPENIKLIHDWQTAGDLQYRLSENNGQFLIHFQANAIGNKTASVNLQTYKPFWTNKKLSCELAPLSCSFNVKSRGLEFLQVDKSDFILDEKSKNEGVEIQIDYNKFLQLNNTYLIEAKETPGSPLIAELFTKERISNNKVLCVLRVFNYHRKSEGYLYIKDDNTAKFVSNFNVIPKVSIEHVKIMRNGKDWVEDATIYPGETFNLRLEGQSLDKAHFRFDELVTLSADSATKNENYVEYKLKVPLSISKKTVEIYNYTQNTGKYFTLKEYQKAHPFDYITVNYGDRKKTVSDMHGPELYDKSIKDVTISFLPNKIDSVSKLYGKQYLSVDIKVLGKKDEIIDMATVDNVAVCPGDKSPRYQFYDKSDCKTPEISVNSQINNPTYSLKDWSKIKLTFKNPSDKYSEEALNKSVEVVLQKHYDFDIDVSFPTGLLIKEVNKPFSNFGGVSMAVMGQYSFYQKDKINQLKPYKVGVGFLALNAFDFGSSSSTPRDIGAVVLGTLNPVHTDRKLTFSIYLGGGYLLSAKTIFWLVGPGINVQL